MMRKIAQVARQFGAEVPFMRPAGIRSDQTLDLPVFDMALTGCANRGLRNRFLSVN
jgi:N-acylneuraminate cytidylyltransferase